MSAADSPRTAITPGPARPATTAWLLAILGWTTVLCFYDLAGGARFEPIDCWVAQTAREMQQEGKWLVPQFSGEVRMQKSPGPYWAVMLVSMARGTPVDEICARIPNALAAVLLVAVIFWLTRHVAGERAAIFAGFAAAGSTLILWWSHRGASDLGLTTCCTVALAAVWIGAECYPRGPRRHALWMLGYFAAGVGMLYKMPMPLVVVGLPAVCYIVLRRRWGLLADRWHLLGLVLFFLPWLPWAASVTLAEGTALAKWRVEFIDRFTGDLPNVEGQGSWKFLFTYLGPPLLYCLPFTLSLPGAFVRAFRRQAGVNRDGTLFMVIWFASLLVFFTASTGKEWRYFLPALPPLFVLLGIELAAFFDPQRAASRQRDLTGAIVVWLALPIGLAACGVFGLRRWWRLRGSYELAGMADGSDVATAYIVTGILLTVSLSLAAWLYYRRREHASFGAIVVTMWATWLWAWPNLVPLLMSQRPFIDMAEQIRAKVPAADQARILNVGSQDSRIIWYGDFRFPRVIDQLELLAEQDYRRDLDYEIRRYGEEMVNKLAGPEPVLFLAGFRDYLTFINAAPPELAKQGRPLPPVHLWLQTRYGREDRHFVLFGNRPPPFPEPALWLSDEGQAQRKEKGWATEWPSSQPATMPATSQGSDG
ncbi:MAG: glycosyltransferase family 39 protein [Phycisphaerae bacterium]|jgi:4-amino-4-deoxy-L-arabinose transferase-like glycosyltransferase